MTALWLDFLLLDFPLKTCSIDFMHFESLFFVNDISIFCTEVNKLCNLLELFEFFDTIDIPDYTDNLLTSLNAELVHIINSDELQNLPDSWENSRAMYHTSIPLTKLYYPEPFVAAPSFLHYDFWFIHISVYVYWIWFLFSFIIVFFIITGLCTIRWCNPRMKPRRETRGISRSKCGDLITAIVPVTWATSIIIHESTDAVDMFDGGGTTNISVGIRAYQWGWEYYYPRSLDLHRKVNPYAGVFLGRTIVNTPYCGIDGLQRKHINKSINRFDDAVNISPHLLILPSKTSSIPFFSKLNHSGRNTKAEHVAFRSVYQYARFLQSELFNPLFIATPNLNVESLFPHDLIAEGSYEIQVRRPHLYTSSLSIINNNNTFSDPRAFNTYVQLIRSNSNLISVESSSPKILYNWKSSYLNQFSKNVSQSQLMCLESLFFSSSPEVLAYIDSFVAFPKAWLYSNFFSNKKTITNFIFKIPLNLNKFALNNSIECSNDSITASHFKKFSNHKQKLSKVIEGSIKNTQEKSIRQQIPQNLNQINLRYTKMANSLIETLNESTQKTLLVPSTYCVNSATDWVRASSLKVASSFKFRNVTLSMPIYSNNPWYNIRNYDLLSNSRTSRPRVFNSRDDLIPESALNFMYNVLESSESVHWKYSSSLNYFNQAARHYFPKHFPYFELDNNRIGLLQQMSDMYWELFCFNLGLEYVADMRVFKYIITQNEGHRAVYWVKMHKISRKYIKMFNKNPEFFFNKNSKELVNLFICRIKNRMLLAWRPNHQLNVERHLLKDQRRKAIPVELDEGFSNLSLLPKNSISQIITYTNALNLLEDSYTAWKAFNNNPINYNFNILSLSLTSVRAQNMLSWLESFTIEYEPTTILSASRFSNLFKGNSVFYTPRFFNSFSCLLSFKPSTSFSSFSRSVLFWFPNVKYSYIIFFFEDFLSEKVETFFQFRYLRAFYYYYTFFNNFSTLFSALYDLLAEDRLYLLKMKFYSSMMLHAFVISNFLLESPSQLTWQTFLYGEPYFWPFLAPVNLVIFDLLEVLSTPPLWYQFYNLYEPVEFREDYYIDTPAEDLIYKLIIWTLSLNNYLDKSTLQVRNQCWNYFIKNNSFVAHIDDIVYLDFFATLSDKFNNYWFDLFEVTYLLYGNTRYITSLAFLLDTGIFCLDNSAMRKKSDIFYSSCDVGMSLAAPLKYLVALANSITGYDAIQKIYRTRYDEHRSNARVEDFAMAALPLHRLSTEKLAYNTYLAKNKINYFDSALIKSTPRKVLNEFYPLYSMVNSYTYDFPFNLAIKSDPARYIWIDWWLNWGLRDVQPASFSRYGLYGMPVFTKLFEYSAPENEMYAEIENYLTRVARVRRLTLSAWTASPYFSARANHWYSDYSLIKVVGEAKYRVNVLNRTLKVLTKSWSAPDLNTQDSKGKLPYFFPANSLAWAPSRSSWRMVGFMQSYYYYGSKLADILTKREYLFRDFLLRKGKLIKIPDNYIASPKHFSFSDLRNGLVAADASFRELDAVRHTSPHLPIVFEYFVLRSYYNQIASYLPFPTLTKLLINLMATENESLELNGRFDDLLYKRSRVQRSQYRALRRGSSNMIRLHATASMAMPVHTRVHLFASSRDVIHSWAIPSAGIKIDCIPGFSSHRIVYFAVHGIFWGQCMEVCGRYHHWMPIVVYFMRRDLFILWCTHFIFLKAKLNFSEIYDHHQNDFIRSVTHDPEGWLAEITK